MDKRLLGSVIIGALATYANAAILITADPVTYSASPGDMVSVPVYLMETDTDVGRIAAESGLIAAAFCATPSVGNSLAVSFTANANAFDTITVNNLGGGGVEVILANFLIDPIAVPGADGRLPLGTLSVTAGTISSTFQLDDNDLSTDGTSTMEGPLDSVMLGSEFYLTVVPEPATLLGLATVGLLLMRRPTR